MSTIDDLIASAAPRTEEVRVCARGDLADRHAQVASEMSQWLSSEGEGALAADSATRAMHQQLADLETEMEAATVTVRLQAVPAHKWANLLMRNAPTREQRDQNFDHDPNKFPAAVIAACAVEPAISLEQAEKLRDTLPTGEWNKLWIAALRLNTEELPSPKLAAATATLLASEASSTPSSLEGSLAEPSSDGSGAQ